MATPLPSPSCLRSFPARQARLATIAGAVADPEPAVAAPAEEEPAILRPVDRVISARVVFDADGEASVEYLAKWKVRQLCALLATDDACMNACVIDNLTVHLGRPHDVGISC